MKIRRTKSINKKGNKNNSRNIRVQKNHGKKMVRDRSISKEKRSVFSFFLSQLCSQFAIFSYSWFSVIQTDGANQFTNAFCNALKTILLYVC